MNLYQTQSLICLGARTVACAAAACSACFLLPQQATASIVEISIAPDSQANSRPSIDNVFDVQAGGGAFNDNLGIGIIINPSFISANVQSDFALHQNGGLFPPSAYDNYVPNPETSQVIYKFDHSTVVSGVEIIEHFNGVTGLSGELGNSISGLSFIGSATSPSAMTDGTAYVFDFGNTTQSGTVFRLTFDHTLLSNAFAIHRAYLLDQNGAVILPAIPEPNTGLLIMFGSAVLLVARARRRTS